MSIQMITRVLALGIIPRDERLVLIALAEKCVHPATECWPGLGTIAQNAGLPKSNARRAIESLAEKRVLTVTAPKQVGRGFSKTYRLHLERVHTWADPSGTEEGSTIADPFDAGERVQTDGERVQTAGERVHGGGLSDGKHDENVFPKRSTETRKKRSSSCAQARATTTTKDILIPPKEWDPDPADIPHAEERRPGVNVPTELKAFCAFNAAARKTAAEWRALWRKWCEAPAFGRPTKLTSTEDLRNLFAGIRDAPPLRPETAAPAGRKGEWTNMGFIPDSDDPV